MDLLRAPVSQERWEGLVRTFFSPACHLYSLPAMVTLIPEDSKGRKGLSRLYIGVTDESTAAEKSGIIRNGGDLELLHGVSHDLDRRI